jgi:hypothetical protein
VVTDLNPNRFRVTPEIEMKFREAQEHRRIAFAEAVFNKMASEMTPLKELELSELPYREFLETHYWRILGNYLRAIHRNRCERCGRRYGLQVHHCSYDHVGAEYRHLEELALLCNECHIKAHGGSL